MGRSSKDKRDVFYRLAKEEGWRARSAFKLLQIQETLNILDSVTRAVDLCAAPGSWSQVLAQTLKPKDGTVEPYIVAVDLQTMSPIPGVKCIKGDITSEETANKIIEAFGGSKAQIVVSDGAPDVTGLHELDERLQSQLLFAALSIATCILEENGTFVSKFFRASDEGIRFNFSRVKYFFEDVTLAKPRSSRASSMECFIIGRKFHLPEGYVPRVAFPDWPKDVRIESAEIPFVTCGDLSGFDSETTYPLPEDYVCREPVQMPIDPPYAAAVQLKKTAKLSNQTKKLSADNSDTVPVLSEAKYSVNTIQKDNPTLVDKMENMRFSVPITTIESIAPTQESPSTDVLSRNQEKLSHENNFESSDAVIESNVFELKPSTPERQCWETPVLTGQQVSSNADESRPIIYLEKELAEITGNIKKMLPTNLENFVLTPEGQDKKPFMTVHLSFRGGLESLFGGRKELVAELPAPSAPSKKWTMELLLEWMKNNIIEERPELFIKDGDIRPGVLIFVNDTDWELFEKMEYELNQADRISFISTLHGG